MGFAARVTGGNLMHAQQANKHRVGPSTVKGRDQTYPACVAGSKIKTDTLSGKTDDHLKSRFCEHFYLVEFLKIFYHPVMAHGLLSKTPKPGESDRPAPSDHVWNQKSRLLPRSHYVRVGACA